MSRRILRVAAASFLVATGSTASPSYPLVFQDELRLTEAPPCTLCHQGSTGAGTVTTDLGRALRSRGLVGGSNEQSLRRAIRALVAEGNPAIAPYVSGAAVPAVVSGPEYGCAIHAPARTNSAWALVLGVCAVLARARRRRA